MEKQPHLVFRLNDELLAIDAMAAREMLWLPELTPVEEAPDYIAGVLNLRGKIIPVTDLNMLFGHGRQRYSLTDSLIVIESPAPEGEVRDALHDERLLGLIVNEVRDVIDIRAEDIEPSPFNGLALKSMHHFIDAEAKAGEDIIMLLNHEKIFDAGFHAAEPGERESPGSRERYFCPEAATDERAVFHRRAASLIPPAVEEGVKGMMPVAIVAIGKEHYGIGLEFVREFSDIAGLTPIPCCPGHIIGNMNLRGNIITVIDIRGLLHLPLASELPEKAIVAAKGELAAGIAVDNVFDVVNVNPADILPVPSAVKAGAEKYIKGTFHFNEMIATLIDIGKVLEAEEMVVNEEA